VGCGPDLVVPGQTGAVFPLADIDGLARALREVLAFDPGATGPVITSHIARYAPVHTAEGVIEAAHRLCRRPLVK